MSIFSFFGHAGKITAKYLFKSFPFSKVYNLQFGKCNKN